MRFHRLSLFIVLGIGISLAPGHAVSNADYLASRMTRAVTPLESTEQFAQVIAPLAGQLVEFEGTVNGIFFSDDVINVLLQLDGAQTAFVMARAQDPDIALGNTLRLTARVPTQGMMLEVLAVTRVTPDLPSLRGAGVGYDVEPDITIPELARQPAPGAPRPAVQTLSAERERVVQIYANEILRINRNLNMATARTIAFHLLEKSTQYNVDPRLTFALMTQESRFNPRAVSRAGAQGLGQLMPRTAAGLGVSNSFDIVQNIDGSVRYLAAQINEFGLPLALAAYNAGPGAVRRFGGIPPYRETQHYVQVVWRNYCRYAGLDPNRAATSR